MTKFPGLLVRPERDGLRWERQCGVLNANVNAEDRQIQIWVTSKTFSRRLKGSRLCADKGAPRIHRHRCHGRRHRQRHPRHPPLPLRVAFFNSGRTDD